MVIRKVILLRHNCLFITYQNNMLSFYRNLMFIFSHQFDNKYYFILIITVVGFNSWFLKWGKGLIM
jgi:hypothetical protein